MKDMDPFIQNLTFKHLKINKEDNPEYVFYYEFEINSYPYSMVMMVDKGVSSPVLIGHNNFGHHCPLCNHYTGHCEVLQKHLDDIYHVISNHPTIRLRGLF